MKALYALIILLVVYMVLKPERPKASLSGRSIASASDTAVALQTEALPTVKKNKSDKTPAIQQNETNPNIENTLKAEIEKARKELSPRTLQWSQHLPKPKNQHEDAFNLYLQIAYENDSESKSLILDRASDFLRLDDSFSKFVFENLNAIEPGRDQNVRNFIYEFSKSARPDYTFAAELVDDMEDFQQNPQKYSEQDLNHLKTLVLSSPGITLPMKRELLETEL